MKIALIDYGAGNLRSVANALREIGADPTIASGPQDLEGATHLILPGVGSFGDCMSELTKRGLVEPIREWVKQGRPYLGICLGYQILFDSSEESPGVSGLGLFRGAVRRFKEVDSLKIPHMGWNSVIPTHPEQELWSELGAEPFFYYVHSFFPVPDDPSVIAAQTEYGADRFAAAIGQDKLFACQYHPEKSQDAGLRLIRNFLIFTEKDLELAATAP
ncbi:imidazole glycerol phosphate synthase subunit HisH [Luteolibacter pohnpeiensis]|uniref:Imidazole glycerol phosphate synthase subunit HisH n=1 Tax=Luteolibacter pohnpeiensis TaxID=454153 RepID=A0A934VV21_9BACT|nr:imidazole glycerol phosphate synthase subunit HisH [Luteolibacter pohnpeiensis]MBK1881735.1 imidazole glycerol phosphate synthase subunit HisH [Luteolibacter pohnpeiensis]